MRRTLLSVRADLDRRLQARCGTRGGTKLTPLDVEPHVGLYIVESSAQGHTGKKRR